MDQHQDHFDEIRDRLPEEEVYYDLAELFRIFGDTTRVKLLYILFEGEMCVAHLAELLGVTQSAVSHQLQILRQSDLVKWRREGKVIYYSLDDEHVSNVFYQGLVHVNEKHHP